MCWKTTLYGFNRVTGEAFEIVITSDALEVSGIIVSYLELPNILLHSVESEKTDEC